jgi:hypothetical protein
MLEGEEATSALAPIIQRLLPDLHGAAWIATRVEVLPGVVDSEIVHVTPAMEHLYRYTWPDTLVGQRISEIHLLADAQITRQYSLLRYHGLEAPRHYVMHGMHPAGHIFQVIKHVQQHTIGPFTLWITHHKPWHRSAPYPFLRLLWKRASAVANEAIAPGAYAHNTRQPCPGLSNKLQRCATLFSYRTFLVYRC